MNRLQNIWFRFKFKYSIFSAYDNLVCKHKSILTWMDTCKNLRRLLARFLSKMSGLLMNGELALLPQMRYSPGWSINLWERFLQVQQIIIKVCNSGWKLCGEGLIYVPIFMILYQLEKGFTTFITTWTDPWYSNLK